MATRNKTNEDKGNGIRKNGDRRTKGLGWRIGIGDGGIRRQGKGVSWWIRRIRELEDMEDGTKNGD